MHTPTVECHATDPSSRASEPSAAQDDAVRAALVEAVAVAGLDTAAVMPWLARAPSPWWALPVGVQVGDLALLAPGLAAGTIRVRIGAPERGALWVLTVVAPDRRGLLATTARLCCDYGLSIRAAHIVSFAGEAVAGEAVAGDVEADGVAADGAGPAGLAGLGSAGATGSTGTALQRLTVEPSQVDRNGEPDWNGFGLALRAALATPAAAPGATLPREAAFTISSVDDIGDGLRRVVVHGADRPGLLAAITQALLDAGADIRSAEAAPAADGSVHDVFVVAGVSPGWPDDTAA